jgi:hypothetical protein
MNADMMSTNEKGEQISSKPSTSEPQQQSTWARPVDHLHVGGMPAGAVNLNVEGRQLTGPLRGFGQLWQKTYRVRLDGVDITPAQVIKVWKEKYPEFWPEGNRFYGVSGIAPGDVAVLNLAGPGGITAPGGRPVISTGVMVIYADDESFTFMTPQGHMFAGIITFSAFEEGGVTVAQTQALVRANDPIYELSFRLKFGHKSEDLFWVKTLKALSAYLGSNSEIDQTAVCVDPRMQWSEAKNLWHNAAVRTTIYLVMTPFRWIANLFNRKA